MEVPLPPNVLIVLLDDVGIDQVSPYGFQGAPPTPAIQALADRGLRFDQAWATPVCSPSRAALLTGQLAQHNQIGAVLHVDTRHELPLELVTLPEMLDRSGTDWSSAAVGKWHLSTPRSASAYKHPRMQGFDLYAGHINNIHVPPTILPETERTYVNWERVDFDGRVSLETTFATTKTVDDALVALEKLEPPWFLYVAFQAAHRPLMMPPPELLGQPASELPSALEPLRGPSRRRPSKAAPDNGVYDENLLYAANVTAADHEIGRLFDALGPARDNTLIFVLGDNGTPRHAKDNDGQEGGKGSFTEGGLRVPFIVAGPGVVAGQHTDAMVHVVDIFPTLMEIAGVRSVGQDLDGVSLVPLFTRPQQQVRTRLRTEQRMPASGPPWRRVEIAVRDEDLKVVSVDGMVQVYRISGYDERKVDLQDLTGDERRRVRKLEGELEKAL